MHTQNPQISKNFLIALHLFEPGNEKMGVFLKRKLKVLSLVWNGKRFLGGVFRKLFEKNYFLSFWKQERRFPPITIKWKKSVKQKSPPDSSNRGEKVVEMLLNCYMKEVRRQFVLRFGKTVLVRLFYKPLMN